MPAYLAWLREHVGRSLVPLVYATALIRDEAGRILLQRRADFGAAWRGLPGGLLEPGETPEAGLRREVAEETGLRVEPLRLTGVYSSPRYNVTYPNGDQVQQITHCYECRIAGGALRADGGEALAHEFFSPGALPPRPLWYTDMIAHALRGRPDPYFDPAEQQAVSTPFPTLLSLRAAVGPAPILWPGAAAIVLDDAGRILLHQRGENGLWGIPAGALDAGETLAHTVVRETLEETGLHVEPVRLLRVEAGYEVTHPNGDRVLPVRHTFACRVLGGELRADGRESLAVRYFAAHALPPLHPTMRQRIHEAVGLAAPSGFGETARPE
jgi:8-oxo-dGTP pyrophosphatase MutT (NUDIX family)